MMYDKDISDTISDVYNSSDKVYLTVLDICSKLQELRDAVRKHRDERGHNRCWLDDKELYQALGDPICEKLNLIPYWKFKRRVELEKKEQEHLKNCRYIVGYSH